MSTYELDDELVAEFLRTLHKGEEEMPAGKMGKVLHEQLPLPVPAKIGAVVRVGQPVYGNVVWIRLSPAGSGRREFQWVGLNDPDTAVSSEKLGRITEVLSEGVDL
jgi:hypothetical protein